jgi:hypothetical protein
MNTLVKTLVFVIMIFVFSSYAFAWQNSPGILDYSKIKCGLSKGCTVSCGYPHYKPKQITRIQEVHITVYSSGMTKLDLIRKGLRGTETILIGPKSYFCDIDNP